MPKEKQSWGKTLCLYIMVFAMEKPFRGFLGNLLITAKGFYFSRLTNTESWHNFTEWRNLPYVDFWISEKENRVEIKGNLGLWLSKQDYEVVAPNFIVPLLNKLRDVDIME